MIAKIHVSEKPKSSITAMPPSRPKKFVSTRKPTRYPMASIRIMMNTLRTRSASVRPASTADRAIGSERNRSMRPLCRSSASPGYVVDVPASSPDPSGRRAKGWPGANRNYGWPPSVAPSLLLR